MVRQSDCAADLAQSGLVIKRDPRHRVPAPSRWQSRWATPAAATPGRMARAGRVPWFPLVVPCVLALTYLVSLVFRFPRLIVWENADSDVASAYVLTDAVSHGHTGPVVMSTQGSWVPLWYGLLTHGLSFHRVLWEISPALLTLAAAILIGLTVASLTSLLRGALAVGLIVAASPIALVNFTAAFHHNTTIPGAALLGAYLVWSAVRPRGTGKLVAGGIAVSLIIGTFVASDELLVVVGLVPFLAAAVLRWLRTRDSRGLAAVIAVTAGSVIVAAITSEVMRSLDFVTTTPDLRFTGKLIPVHAIWLLQGLLRIGNGLSVGHRARLPSMLVIAAAVVTIAAILALYWRACRSMVRPAGAGSGRARDLYTLYWAGSLLCAAAAYVLTTIVRAPTDRYLIIVVPALAATAPLAIISSRTAWLSATAASVFMLASILALLPGGVRSVIYDGGSTPEAQRIMKYVSSQHLSVGYAGYWDAANLDWITHGRLHVYPITDYFGPTEPMYQTRVQSWYRPRPHTPSYLLLAPYDLDLRDRLPRDLPLPQREVHIGPITLAVYPYDIAGFLHQPSRPPSS